MIPTPFQIKLFLALAGIGAFLYAFGNFMYKAGQDSQQARCGANIQAVHSSISKSNAKVVEREERQKQSYSMALKIRNDQYTILDQQLRERINEARNYQGGDYCANQPIPLELR